MSYILAAIYSGQLGVILAFKGGTALRKCYFRGYRFSEDLDFTLLEQRGEAVIESQLEEACTRAEKLISPFGRFRFIGQRQVHRQDHPFGQIDYRIQVEYPTGASLPIKVEITRDEPVVLPLVKREIIHLFEGEDPNSQIYCYSLEEIAIEKLRAFLQARQNLERRNWLNRPRDLYDLWYLYRQYEQRINWPALRQPLAAKARVRGVSYDGISDFKHPAVLSEYQRQWNSRLHSFVSELPAFEEAAIALDRILERLFT
ncbi:MAG: nucleotidyl transferase AbiEii/AbiGii toxin family protein [Candidatus Dormibacteraceae bacterium]